MIVKQNNHPCIHIPGMAHLFATPTLNMFSTENGVLHYNAQGEEEVEEAE